MQILRRKGGTRVAIRFITKCELAGHRDVAIHEDEANQLASIFSAIVRNKKANMQRQKRS